MREPAAGVVRRATPEDAAWIADLEQVCFGADAWSPTQVAEELTTPVCWAWVLTAPGGPLGYVVVRDAGEVTDLERIAVRPDARRQGVASRLLDAARPAQGRLLLEVSAENDAALAFYAGAGFTEISRRRRYYRDGSDAVVLAGSGGQPPTTHWG